MRTRTTVAAIVNRMRPSVHPPFPPLCHAASQTARLTMTSSCWPCWRRPIPPLTQPWRGNGEAAANANEVLTYRKQSLNAMAVSHALLLRGKRMELCVCMTYQNVERMIDTRGKRWHVYLRQKPDGIVGMTTAFPFPIATSPLSLSECQVAAEMHRHRRIFTSAPPFA